MSPDQKLETMLKRAGDSLGSFEHLPKRLGEGLKLFREAKGISRAGLARQAGISVNSLVKYEKAGEKDGQYPPLPKLVLLAKLLEIDPRYIFDTVYSDVISGSEGFSFGIHFGTPHDWEPFKQFMTLMTDEISEVKARTDELSEMREQLLKRESAGPKDQRNDKEES